MYIGCAAALSSLRDQRVLLPGVTTPTRRVASIRDQATTGCGTRWPVDERETLEMGRRLELAHLPFALDGSVMRGFDGGPRHCPWV